MSLIAITAGGGIFVPRQAAGQNGPAHVSQNLMPGAAMCMIMPETTEGPFYFDPDLVRQDITEGREGVPLTARLQVVDAACEPTPSARVDIWHCDAKGRYSGYPGQGDDRTADTSGESFLRGTQIADDSGIAEFRTIYPGWYRGRTPHIHFMVFVDDRTTLTGQMFFPDEVSKAIYTRVAPYTERTGGPETFNDNDAIARRAGPAALAAVREIASAYEAELIVAVDPAA
jgi:protocatechuate 3,4-dioxygenase beta subunit